MTAMVTLEPLTEKLRRRLRAYTVPGRLGVVAWSTDLPPSLLHASNRYDELLAHAVSSAQYLGYPFQSRVRDIQAVHAALADDDTAPIERPSLAHSDCLPVVGQPGYVVCAGDPYLKEGAVLVDRVQDGVTTLSWPDDACPGGRRRQVFTTRIVTSSIEAAAASRAELVAAGWWWLQ